MIALIQRVSEAKVMVESEITGQIGAGLLIFLGVFQDDSRSDVAYLTQKTAHLRIFDDEKGKMNRSLLHVGGEALVVSQFTLCADTQKGRRPSFVRAAPPALGQELYDSFIRDLKETSIAVETGRFGAMMDVHLVNDGPVTLVLDSKSKQIQSG